MGFEVETAVKIAAYTGGGIAMGLGAVGAAIGEGYTAARANLAVSRNPEISGDIFKNMLVGQAVAESASIFALVIAILLLFMNTGTPSMLKAAAFLGAGFSMGFGAIGSGIGSGYPGGEACYGISRQPAAGSQLTTNMLIGSAVCQTPAIFSMVGCFCGSRPEYGACRHRIRLRRRTGSRCQLRGYRPDAPVGCQRNHHHAGRPGGCPNAGYFWIVSQFYSDV
jgi:ATP synthase F0 subunit c